MANPQTTSPQTTEQRTSGWLRRAFAEEWLLYVASTTPGIGGLTDKTIFRAGFIAAARLLGEHHAKA